MRTIIGQNCNNNGLCLCYTCVGTQSTSHWTHYSFTPHSQCLSHSCEALWVSCSRTDCDELDFAPPTSLLFDKPTLPTELQSPHYNHEFVCLLECSYFLGCHHPVIKSIFIQKSPIRNLPDSKVTCLNLMCVARTDFGPEDGDGEKGGTTVFHEDVHGLTALIHLPHEVCDHVDSVLLRHCRLCLSVSNWNIFFMNFLCASALLILCPVCVRHLTATSRNAKTYSTLLCSIALFNCWAEVKTSHWATVTNHLAINTVCTFLKRN